MEIGFTPVEIQSADALRNLGGTPPSEEAPSEEIEDELEANPEAESEA